MSYLQVTCKMDGSALVRSSFRSIVRHLRSLPSARTPQAAHKLADIKLRFARGKLETDEAAVAQMREDARLYATLVDSISELRALRELDTGDKLDPRSHINATAARVGFSLPSYSDNDQDFEGAFPQPEIVPSRFSPDTHFGQQHAAPEEGAGAEEEKQHNQ